MSEVPLFPWTVTTWVGGRCIAFRDVLNDPGPSFRHTVTVGWPALLRGLLRGRLVVEVVVDHEPPPRPTDDKGYDYVPPAGRGLPVDALNSATHGADMIDAVATTPGGRNFLAHALVQLARDGWLRRHPEPFGAFDVFNDDRPGPEEWPP